MTTLASLQKSVNGWIEKHGPDHEIACFTFQQDELQQIHLQEKEYAAAENADRSEIIPLSDEELTAAVRHLEEHGQYRLYLPALEAISHVNALSEST